MTNTSYYGSTGMIGSSFASPAIMSVAVQAQQYEGFFSQMFYPIMKKAVLMAGSVDSNYASGVGDGEVLKGSEWTSSASGSPTDGEDGAGHPDMGVIKSTLDNNRYAYAQVTNASFTSAPCDPWDPFSPICRDYTIATFQVAAGKRVKAALVWNICPGASSPKDFDLVLVQPAWCNNATHQSVSVNNEVEMVFDTFDTCQVTAPVQGTYTAKVRIKNGGLLGPLCGSETNEPVAFAWGIR